MDFILTNEDRLYLGLPLLRDNWERYVLSPNQTIYFECNTIVKSITIENDSYYEVTYSEETSEDHLMILPKTKKGKAKKLSSSTLQSKTPIGTYFNYYKGTVTIGNFTTQRTFYSSSNVGVEISDFIELRDWLKNWKESSSQEDLEDIKQFSKLKRKHFKFQEGDFFRFKYDRHQFGFGRILLDVHKMRKEKIPIWDVVMGKPLIIKVYHFVSEHPNVDIDMLSKLDACPSQYIMDNNFYYGDYQIISNKPLEVIDKDYPILYGRSINFKDLNKICFQEGKIYKELDLRTSTFIGNYRNSAVGFVINVNLNKIIKCIQDRSNQPYWDMNHFDMKKDLRHPENVSARKKVYNQMGIKRTEK